MTNNANNNKKMVNEQVKARGVNDKQVLKAMKNIDRALFVEQDYQELSYSDRPLPIGYNQTISQPFIVGFMTSKLDIKKEHKVLEIGSGCGYQTAILCKLANYVYAIDIVAELVKKAKANLSQLDLDNYELKCANGRKGWQEQAPFDRILVAAASNDLPSNLLEQLQIGGKMIIPYGKGFSQNLILVTKHKDGIEKERILSVRFVPLLNK